MWEGVCLPLSGAKVIEGGGGKSWATTQANLLPSQLEKQAWVAS